MANRKFLFVNAGSEIEEEVLSVSTGAGASDAGKLITLNPDGYVDVTLLPPSIRNGFDWKGSVRVAAEVDIDIAAPGTAIDGVTLALGDRVLLAGQTDGEENGIYVFDTDSTPLVRSEDADESAEVTSQLRVAIAQGTRASQVAYLTTNDPIVLDTTVLVFAFDNPAALVGGAGITISTGVVSIDLLGTDSGLALIGVGNAAQLAVDFADTSDTDDLDGTNDLKPIAAEDLYLNGANQGANILGVDPTNISQSSQTLLQGVLEDLSAAIEGSDGQYYTVGAGGVDAGDLVYISANNTILPLAIANDEFGIGLAATTEAAAGTVLILANDEIALGVLSGATAGDKYFWNGSALTTTAPTGSGNRVWQVGIAKNATDLHVQIDLIKRNS